MKKENKSGMNVEFLKPLAAAVRDCDVKKVNQLLLSGKVDVNEFSDGYFVDGIKFNVTALHIACDLGNSIFFQFLLNNGADINLRTKDNVGATALHFAHLKKRKKIVDKLLEKKAMVLRTYDSAPRLKWKNKFYNEIGIVQPNEIKKVVIKHKREKKILKDYMNIITVGPQHSGKSCFINTVYKYNKPHSGIGICGEGRRAKRGTIYYQRVRIKKGLFFFDVAGQPFESGDEDSKGKLNFLLKGLKTSTDLINKNIWENPENAEPKNKIDMMIVVISAVQMFNGETLNMDYVRNMRKLYTLVENLLAKYVCRGLAPVLIITNKNGINEEKRKKLRETLMTNVHSGRIFFIENHISSVYENEMPDETKKKLGSILGMITDNLRRKKIIFDPDASSSESDSD